MLPLSPVPVLPPGLRYVDIAAGTLHGVGRRSDGSVIAWGYDYYGEKRVPGLPPGLAFVQIAAGSVFTAARVAPATICQPDLGLGGPGSATATLCGNGLDAGEKSDYTVTAAPANAPGLLAISLHGFPNIRLLGGTLASFGGFIVEFPVLADGNGRLSVEVPGDAVVADLVIQSVFLDRSVPRGVAFTNAVLARYGR
jgi:hypothetical protein